MKALEISARTWGMTNTSVGRAFVGPDGQACQVNIRTYGCGKFSRGEGRIFSTDYPEGVYEVVVGNRRVIAITFYPPSGGMKKMQPVLAPEPVQRFAQKFKDEADCYHCKCLQRHLNKASKAARDESVPLLTV